MFPAINPTTTGLETLDKHYKENMKETQFRQLFQQNPNVSSNFHL